MSGSFFLGVGSGLITLWGIAHIVPTKKVIGGLGKLSEDARRIFTMTWVTEGLTLVFIGVQVGILVLVFGGDSYTVFWVARICAVMLVVLAVLTGFTGARTKIVPMKICPFVKLLAAVMLLIGTLYF